MRKGAKYQSSKPNRMTAARLREMDAAGELIECRLCNKKMAVITNSHLRTHGTTPDEYRTSFPGAPLVCAKSTEVLDSKRYKAPPMPTCRKPGCSNTVTQRHNNYCSSRCSMSDRMSRTGRNEQSGEKNPIYKNDGDAGWETYSDRQKAKARIRDSHTCQRCGNEVSGRAAHVHHLTPARCFTKAEEAHALDNLVLLCGEDPPCHKIAEWAVLKEMYARAIRLDELKKDDPTHVPISVVKREICYNKSK